MNLSKSKRRIEMKTQKTKLIWLRRDNETTEIKEISEAEVKVKLKGYYRDVKLAMENATAIHPVTTGYADYWSELWRV
jgi:hypothetical protein